MGRAASTGSVRVRFRVRVRIRVTVTAFFRFGCRGRGRGAWLARTFRAHCSMEEAVPTRVWLGLRLGRLGLGAELCYAWA